MRTHSREDAAKAPGRTAATSTVPAQERRDYILDPIPAATRRPGQATDHAGLAPRWIARSRQRLQAA